MKNAIGHIKNPQIQKVLVAILIVALAVGGFVFWQMQTGRVFIDDSLVSAPVANIAPDSPGTLQEVDVYEGEHITKGQPLAVIAGQTLFATTNGIVIMSNNQIGSTISPQNPAVSLIDPNQMRIAGTIDENKGLSDIKIGQVASFTVDALPGDAFWGYVDEISPSAKTSQLAFSISSERPTQQFVVYVKYNAEQYPQIKNGMSAKLTIFTNTN